MSTDCVDDDSEWEEEEQLVVVHLSGIIDTEYLKKCDPTNCKILGVDTEEPILQIDKMCFRGSYDDCVGTNIIFEEKGEVVDGKVVNSKTLKYMCHTEKALDMVRVFYKREDNVESTDLGEGSQLESTVDDNVENGPEGVTNVASEVKEFSGNDIDDSQRIEVAQSSTHQNEHHATPVVGPDAMDCT